MVDRINIAICCAIAVVSLMMISITSKLDYLYIILYSLIILIKLCNVLNYSILCNINFIY